MSKIVNWRYAQKTLFAIVATASVVAVSANSARADLVINNPSFEGNVLSDGEFNGAAPAGWASFAQSGGNGMFNPPVANVLQPSHGDNVGSISGVTPGLSWGTGVFFQDMGAPAAGSYSISADLAIESGATGGFEFWIQAFDTLGGPVGLDGAVDFADSHGNTFRGVPYASAPGGGLKTDVWTTVTLTFSIDPLDPFFTAGDQNLRLVITNQGSNASAGAARNMLVDNVQISFTAVPEPGSMSILGIGIVGIGIARRKWRVKYSL